MSITSHRAIRGSDSPEKKAAFTFLQVQRIQFCAAVIY